MAKEKEKEEVQVEGRPVASPFRLSCLKESRRGTWVYR
jgi:hypothetical protein